MEKKNKELVIKEKRSSFHEVQFLILKVSTLGGNHGDARPKLSAPRSRHVRRSTGLLTMNSMASNFNATRQGPDRSSSNICGSPQVPRAPIIG